jgi:HSP20 family protein
MSLMQWNPFREMDDFFTQMQRSLARVPTVADGDTRWAPAVDISETPSEYTVKAELPGLTREQVKVTVDNRVLTLSGERKFEKEDKDEKHHRIERSYGSFTRSFSLPDDVLTEQISAECNNGVLRVRLPRSEARKAKSIEVKVQ